MLSLTCFIKCRKSKAPYSEYLTPITSEKAKMMLKQEKNYWIRVEKISEQKASTKYGLRKFFSTLLHHIPEG